MNEALRIKKTLYINTSESTKVTVGLKIDDKEYKDVRQLDTRKSQIVLPMIDELLKKYELTLHDLTGIDVFTGPGSFTGLRVGISIANTLGTLLHIPINNKEVGTLVSPRYA